MATTKRTVEVELSTSGLDAGSGPRPQLLAAKGHRLEGLQGILHAHHRQRQLAFPAQNIVTGKLRQASAKAGRPDFVAMWAGQAAPPARWH